jgi:ubiquinone/menaquinone biosynthesis C-methylase UbiE
MEWATYAHLAEPSFFLVTRELYGIESEIAARGCERQTDALYFTRRVEYPWAFLQIPSNTQTALDAGGGAATFQYLLSKYLPVVYNVDLNPEWVSKVNGVKAAIHGFSNLNAVQGDLSDLSQFSDGAFDAALCISALEHGGQEKVERIVEELTRVTNGPVLITVDIGVGSEMMPVEVLQRLAAKYGFAVPPYPESVMVGLISGKQYRVACVRLDSHVSAA